MSEAAAAWRIERARPEQAARLAEIHAGALPDDFLPSLGRDFLERVYYPAALESPDGAHLTAVADGATLGFVCIAHDAGRFTSGVIRERLGPAAFYACRAIARRPARLRSVLEIAWSVVAGAPDTIRGEIVFIAIDPAYHGRGIGSALVSAAMEHLKSRGVDRCRTKTLASNDGVIRMYERLGWSIRDRFAFIGRRYVTIVSPLLLS